MKKCCICKTEKDKKEFHLDRGKKDGLDPRCKVCKMSRDTSVSRARRDARRYEKDKNKTIARGLARRRFGTKFDYKCAVLNCVKNAKELHHVTYEDPYAVVPLCSEHHRMNHDLCR